MKYLVNRLFTNESETFLPDKYNIEEVKARFSHEIVYSP